MLPRSFLLLLLVVICAVQSAKVLFNEGRIKFARNGKRLVFNDVEHIDDVLIGDDHPLVIVKASMDVLHPQAVRNLKQLHELICKKCRITTLESGAFVNLPNLTVLRLQDNQIEHIQANVFNRLPVKILDLHRNQIQNIDSAAFDDMPNLYKIKLNNNKLKVWDAKWFGGSPKITELFFRRNKIAVLPPSAFANVKSTDAKLFLSKNKLHTLTPHSFHNLKKVSQLYLDRNNISSLPDDLFADLEAIDVIYLARNKIHQVSKRVFPKIAEIGFLDLSSNLLTCLPYELVSLANITNLERNNGSCECVRNYKTRLQLEKKKKEISYDADSCK